MKHLFTCLLAFICIGLPRSGSAAANTLTGTWNVIITDDGVGTCPGIVPGTMASKIWVITTQPNGLLSVAVQGDTATASLSGTMNGNQASLTGTSGASEWFLGLYSATSSWYVLTLVDDKLTGSQEFLKIVTRTDGTGHERGRTIASPCVSMKTVQANRLK